jgi:hypothetical protein
LQHYRFACVDRRQWIVISKSFKDSEQPALQ